MSKLHPSGLPKLVGAAVVAESIDASVKTVYRMAKDGRIPSFNLGGMIRFDPVRINEWIEAGKMAA